MNIISFVYKRKRFGFTLSEVLITMTIIGVIAALTIPTMMMNIQVEQFRSQLKKEYSALTQAINTLQSQNGSVDTSSQANFVTDLSSQISIQKTGTWASLTTLPSPFNYKCYKSNSGTCSNGGDGLSLVARPTYDATTAFITNDGVRVILTSTSSNCTSGNWHAKINPAETLPLNNSCLSMYMDLNGDKGPNMIGVDMHAFVLLMENNFYYIRPFGANVDTLCLTGYPEDYNRSLHCTTRMLLDMPMP